MPDHRGSTGHGRAYQQALRGGWGELDVADTVACIDHAHAAGWAEPDRTVVMGGSSGGFTVLGVLGLFAGRAAAGGGRCTRSPTSPSWPPAATASRPTTPTSLVGPPSDDGAATARGRSLSYVQDIAAPLLVMHGTDDPAVPVEGTIAFVDALRAAGGDVELHLFEGEGHGFRQPANQLAEYRLITSFLTGTSPEPCPTSARSSTAFWDRSSDVAKERAQMHDLPRCARQDAAVASRAVSEWDPNDPETVNVHYDVSAWSIDQRAELTEALAEAEIAHVWEDDELVVPEEQEDVVDELFERLEELLGPFAVPLRRRRCAASSTGSTSGRRPIARR